MKSTWLTIAVVVCTAAIPGCAATVPGDAPPRPALISHIVLISLYDPSEADALISDCDSRLSNIPSVVSYAAGRHIDTDRANVIADYDVGLYIGFDSTDGYAEYVEHPDHVGLVNDWRPRIKALVVRDVLDESP